MDAFIVAFRCTVVSLALGSREPVWECTDLFGSVREILIIPSLFWENSGLVDVCKHELVPTVHVGIGMWCMCYS